MAYTDILDDIVAVVDVVHTLYPGLGTAGGKVDTAIQGLTGDRSIDTTTQALVGVRQAFNQALDAERWRSAIWALIQDYAAEIGIPWSAINRESESWLLYHVKKHMDANSKTFKRRGFTFGAQNPSPSSGAGPILRLTVDEWAYPLEGVHIETKTWRCTRDATMGVLPGAEVFQVLGGNPERWLDKYDDSGLVDLHEVETCTRSGFLTNPSFDATHGSTASAADKVPGWVITGTATNITRNTAFYKNAPGASDANSACLEFTGAATIAQAFGRRASALRPSNPYQVAIGYKKTNSGATGTLTIALGATTKALNLSSISDTDWHFLYLDLDEDLYMRNWNEADADVSIAVASLSAGSIYVDDVIFAGMRPIDGHWWLPIGGETPFALDDEFTFSTALAGSDAVVQYWLWRFGFGSWPNSATPSEADPS